MTSYGSCSLFKPYSVDTTAVSDKAVLGSNALEEVIISDDDMTALEFVAIGMVCAVLAPES